VEWLISIIVGILFYLLPRPSIKWLVRKIHLDRIYEKRLRKLGKYRPAREALTMKEIIDKEIIKSVDPEVISPQIKKRIQEGLARWGLVRRKWDDILETPLSFNWKQFFIYHGSLLSNVVVPNLNELYQNIKIACFVVLPFPRHKKHKPIEGFMREFEKCLGSQPINIEYMVPATIDKKIKPSWLTKIKDGEKILIIQPMAMDDDYLERTLKFVSDFSAGVVYEVITIIDASGRPATKRSVKPTGRILLEFNLSNVQ